MKTKIIYVIAILCLIFAKAHSQELKELKIGDTIPEKLWTLPLKVINHPEGKKTITLNEYRNKKLIILDFWAVWCKPCVAGIDKMIPVYEKHIKDMILLPVNSYPLVGENDAVFMKKKAWSVQSVIETDQFLHKKVFPPPIGTGIPRVIWIKDNKVIAIPLSKYITEENIVKAINNEQLSIEMDTTNYYPLDYTKPLFVGKNGATGLYYKNPAHAVISRYLRGYGQAYKTQFLQVGDTTIIAAINRRLEDILFDAWEPWIFPKLDATSGIIWNISDSLKTRLFNGPKYNINHLAVNDNARQKWNSENLYGYNLRFPEKIRENEAQYFMQQDLKKFFRAYMNLSFIISPAIKHKYAILKLLASQKQSIALLSHRGNKSGTEEINGRKYFNNHRYKEIFLFNVQQAITGLTIPEIVDNTGLFDGLMVDFELPKDIYGNITKLNDWLKSYGLTIEIKEELVPVLVVTEENPNSTGM